MKNQRILAEIERQVKSFSRKNAAKTEMGIADPHNLDNFFSEGLQALAEKVLSGKAPEYLIEADQASIGRRVYSVAKYEARAAMRSFARHGLSSVGLSPVKDIKVNADRLLKAITEKGLLKGQALTVFSLYFIEGLKQSAIAKDLNISQPAIAKQIKRITTKLASSPELAGFFDDPVESTGFLTENQIVAILDSGGSFL